MKSWQTTAAGIATAAIIILQQFVNAVDSDEQTVFSLSAVVAALTTLYGFIVARDNNKSSESVGAK